MDRDARKKVRALERELQRKEKALAETAALLTLSKKARAIWGRARRCWALPPAPDNAGLKAVLRALMPVPRQRGRRLPTR